MSHHNQLGTEQASETGEDEIITLRERNTNRTDVSHGCTDVVMVGSMSLSAYIVPDHRAGAHEYPIAWSDSHLIVEACECLNSTPDDGARVLMREGGRLRNWNRVTREERERENNNRKTGNAEVRHGHSVVGAAA